MASDPGALPRPASFARKIPEPSNRLPRKPGPGAAPVRPAASPPEPWRRRAGETSSRSSAGLQFTASGQPRSRPGRPWNSPRPSRARSCHGARNARPPRIPPEQNPCRHRPGFDGCAPPSPRAHGPGRKPSGPNRNRPAPGDLPPTERHGLSPILHLGLDGARKHGGDPRMPVEFVGCCGLRACPCAPGRGPPSPHR